MPANKLLQRIRSLEKLTRSELRLADFISQNATQAVFENVTSLAQKTGVSKATVVRFISKLGYENFNDLRRSLQEDAWVTFESLPKRYRLKKQELEYNGKDVLEKNFNDIIRNLQHISDTIDRETFHKAAQLMLEKKGNLYVCGFRTSYALAQMFHIMIKRIRPNSFLIGPQIAIMPEMLLDVTSNDILLAVFRHPYVRQTAKIAERFSGVGARILLVTDSNFSPLSSLATNQIIVGSEGGSIFRSFTTVTAVLEALHLAVLQLCDVSLSKRIESAAELMQQFDIYCLSPSEDLRQKKRSRKHRAN
jgi:DNA-binding MurR/RpiR family transcriptional regulator